MSEKKREGRGTNKTNKKERHIEIILSKTHTHIQIIFENRN